MSIEFMHALGQLEKEKGIDKELLIETIEAALISAYKKNFGSSQNVNISVDRDTGDVRVFEIKNVKKEIESDEDISIEEARLVKEDAQDGDTIEMEVTPRKFGRIAAQTAKQVVVQRIREAERNIVFDEFFNKENDIVTGIVQRSERRNVIIDLGKAEANIPYSEQVSAEQYRFNERMKVYIIEVKKTTKGPQIIVSRTHPGLVKRLFELEVPEIYNGIVEIKNICREPGSRTKIAVYSKEENVDPVGACVGQRGTRVQAIVDELRGEKIDIIQWSSNVKEFISSSLNPAKVIRVDIDEENKSAKVTVPDYQLSLAIGKEGQNARLAAKLTGWKIDIKNESQLRADIEQQLLNFNENVQYDEEAIAEEIDEEKIDEDVIGDEESEVVEEKEQEEKEQDAEGEENIEEVEKTETKENEEVKEEIEDVMEEAEAVEEEKEKEQKKEKKKKADGKKEAKEKKITAKSKEKKKVTAKKKEKKPKAEEEKKPVKGKKKQPKAEEEKKVPKKRGRKPKAKKEDSTESEK